MTNGNKKNRFKKGNPGRPKGAKDKKTYQWKELQSLMTEGEILDKVTKYLMTLKDDELFKAFKDLLNYFKPRQASTEHKLDDDTKKALGIIYYPKND
jgi:hypothetical protein